MCAQLNRPYLGRAKTGSNIIYHVRFSDGSSNSKECVHSQALGSYGGGRTSKLVDGSTAHPRLTRLVFPGQEAVWSASGPAGRDFWPRIGPRGEPYPHLLLKLVAFATGGGLLRRTLRMMHGGFLDGGWSGHRDGRGLGGDPLACTLHTRTIGSSIRSGLLGGLTIAS